MLQSDVSERPHAKKAEFNKPTKKDVSNSVMSYRAKCRSILHGIILLALASCANQPAPEVNVFNQLDLASIKLEHSNLLMLSAEQGSATGVKKALEQGELLNGVGPNGSAFSLALKNDHEGLSLFLLSAGADWNLGFRDGDESALMVAAEGAMNKLLKALIVRDADMNYINEQGESAVSRAALGGHLTTLKILIEAGASVTASPHGRSILMHSVEDNNMLISQMLIDAGADVNFRDEEGDSALRIARRRGFVDLDLLLMQSGARP